MRLFLFFLIAFLQPACKEYCVLLPPNSKTKDYGKNIVQKQNRFEDRWRLWRSGQIFRCGSQRLAHPLRADATVRLDGILALYRVLDYPACGRHDAQ